MVRIPLERIKIARLGLPIILALAFVVILALSFQLFPVAASPDTAPSPLTALNQPGAPAPQQPQDFLTIPHVPAGVPSPVVNGACSDAGYTGGLVEGFTDLNGFAGTVHLVHDDSYLYVCMTGALGSFRTRFASVYLDTRNDSEPYAGPNDFALRADIETGANSSFQGSGVPNGYVPITLGNWNAATTTGNFDIAEYRIALPLTGGACGDHFRMAVYHHWLTGVGNDFGWPSAQYFDQPATWQEVALGQAVCASGKIAYVYREDTYTAGKFKALLTSVGFTVDLIPLSSVLTTDFTGYDVILIANDTGSLDQWGTLAGQVTSIVSANKPTIGLGEGGYAFFGKLGKFIGWPQGWHGPQDRVIPAAPALAYYHTPYDFTGLLSNPIPLYLAPINEVGIYVKTIPAGVTVIGLELPALPSLNPDHAPLIAQDCNQLWGYSNGPQDMTDNGKRLFVNAVVFASGFQCPTPPPPPPPDGCVTLTKSAKPDTTALIHPGDVVTYTLSYSVAGNKDCTTTQATLVDPIPFGAKFVPGSASDGVSPNIEDTLVWSLGSLSPGASGSKTFSVFVLDTTCADQTLANQAQLTGSTGVFDSNLLKHGISCPPVVPPNREPPYAEEEVQVYPYPLVTGHPTQLSTRIRNLTAITQTVTVTFQTSPEHFGIGLNYNAIPVPGNPRVVSLPPNGVVEVNLEWVPVTSGHQCIQVKIEEKGFSPVYTQRNMDVAEDLRPGVTDDLHFAVGNPTAATANIDLVVDNTCPGWTASVTPATLSDVGPHSLDIRSAVLHVTPPTSGVLGTGCHIDVQGWINGRLIGGIRKLDVPPVHLERSQPPWEEKEITLNPSPAVVGLPTQFCIEIQNPLPVSKVVTLTYSVADFGAGIPIIPVATQQVTLPPASLDKYCITWTPATGGTLHRCLFVQVHQPGFQDQTSQRNVDLVHATPVGPQISFTIGNPFPYTRTLTFQTEMIGTFGLMPHILPDPPPGGLGPGRLMNFTLEVLPAMPGSQAFANFPTAINSFGYGDTTRVEVGVYLGGELTGGFTVVFQQPILYLPVINR